MTVTPLSIHMHSATVSDMTTLAEFVRQKRVDAGYETQAALADASGVDREVVNRIERGKTMRPEAYVRRRLAKALGVSHLDLLVAAGEITEAELGTVAGVVERDPDDPRDALADRIRDARLDESDLRMFNLMLDNLDAKTGRDREGRGG